MNNEQLRPTWAEISQSALAHNIGIVQTTLPDCGILAMIKADGYGHGAVLVAKALAEHDVTAFGVATLEEAGELRSAGITQPIVCMGGLMGIGERAADFAVAHDITCVVHSSHTLKVLDEAAQCAGKAADYHLKIDTGMGRMGVQLHHLADTLRVVTQCKNATLRGVMSHLSSADDATYSAMQLAQFQRAAAQIKQEIPEPLIWHLGLSSAIINADTAPQLCRPTALRERDQYWVRPGIMLYGITPFVSDQGKCDLRPVMALKSRIALIRTLPEGAKVSYGGTWTATRDSRIGTIPMGYADGYPWRAHGNSTVLIRGERAAIVGRITMDLLLVDLTDIPEAIVGDEVCLFGDPAHNAPSAEELADVVETSPYEIVCRVSKRVPRTLVMT